MLSICSNAPEMTQKIQVNSVDLTIEISKNSSLTECRIIDKNSELETINFFHSLSLGLSFTFSLNVLLTK